MVTTIQISRELLSELKKRKMHERESYEEVIWDLLEDTTELSKETKLCIKEAEVEYEKGKTHSLAEVKEKLGLK